MARYTRVVGKDKKSCRLTETNETGTMQRIGELEGRRARTQGRHLATKAHNAINAETTDRKYWWSVFEAIEVCSVSSHAL